MLINDQNKLQITISLRTYNSLLDSILIYFRGNITLILLNK